MMIFITGFAIGFFVPIVGYVIYAAWDLYWRVK